MKQPPSPQTRKRNRKSEPLEVRALRNIRINHETECWEWTRSTGPAGYARSYRDTADGMREAVAVHRHMYEMAHGTVPVGYVIHHKCEVRCCINPAHLEALTPSDHLRVHGTMAKLWAGSRRKRETTTTCSRGHAYAENNNLYLAPEGRRQCRECNRLIKRARNVAPCPRCGGQKAIPSEICKACRKSERADKALRDSMLLPTKACAGCGERFTKRRRASMSQWEERKYCSQLCGVRAQPLYGTSPRFRGEGA